MDAAGTVIGVGSAVRGVRIGDRVMGLVSGGYAQLALLDQRLAIPVPRDWTDVDAAAAVAGPADPAQRPDARRGLPGLADSVRCLAVGGRLVSVGRLGGDVGELDLEQLAFKQARIIGVTFRTRTLEQHEDIVRDVIDDLLPALDRGHLRPIIDRTYPLAAAMEAQARMAANQHRGKLVLTVAPTTA